MQRDHTVATKESRNGLAVDTGFFIELLRQRGGQVRIDLYGVTGANRIVDVRLVGTVEINIQIIDAIQRIEGNQRVIVMQRVIRKRGGVLLFVSGSPFMGECLVERRADIQRVAEDMGLMNGEVQHNGTVATGSTMHRVAVDTRYYE